MLIAYFEFENNIDRHYILKAITKNLITENVLEEKFRTRFYKILDKQSFDSAIDYYGDPKISFRRIVDGLETTSHETQNPIIDYLKTDRAISLISGLDLNKQLYLGQLISQAALNGHWKSQYFVNSIVSNQYKYSDFIKSGIALANILTNKKVLRIDYNDMQRAFETYNGLSDEALQASFNELDQFFEKNKPSDWDVIVFDKDKFDIETPKILTTVTWTSENAEIQSETLILKIKKLLCITRTIKVSCLSWFLHLSLLPMTFSAGSCTRTPHQCKPLSFSKVTDFCLRRPFVPRHCTSARLPGYCIKKNQRPLISFVPRHA